MTGKQKQAIDHLAKVLKEKQHDGQLDMARKLAGAIEETTSIGMGLECFFNHRNYRRIQKQLDDALADYQAYVGKRLKALRTDTVEIRRVPGSEGVENGD